MEAILDWTLSGHTAPGPGIKLRSVVHSTEEVPLRYLLPQGIIWIKEVLLCNFDNFYPIKFATMSICFYFSPGYYGKSDVADRQPDFYFREQSTLVTLEYKIVSPSE